MATISTTITHGVTLATTGSYASPLTITSTGAVEPTSGNGILGPTTQAWTVINEGTVVEPGTLGSVAIYLGDGGYIDNAGGQILGQAGIIIRGNAGSVTNSGTISAVGQTGKNGVELDAGGEVNNLAGAILVIDGIYIKSGAGMVSNSGTILGSSPGYFAPAAPSATLPAD